MRVVHLSDDFLQTAAHACLWFTHRQLRSLLFALVARVPRPAGLAHVVGGVPGEVLFGLFAAI